MAKIVPSFDPNIMEIRKGGGIFIVIGCVPVVIGMLLSIAYLGEGFRDDAVGFFMVMMMQFIFVTLGLGFIVWRGGIIMDRHYKTLTTWWGIMVPISRNEMQLKSCEKVTIRKEIRRNKNSTYMVFVARIIMIDKVPEVKITEEQQYLEVRRMAEAVAKFIHVPMVDYSDGTEVIRPADELDQTLRDRLLQKKQVRELEDLPEYSKIIKRMDDKQCILFLPRIGWGLARIIVFVLGLFVTAIMGGLGLGLAHTTGVSFLPLILPIIGILICFFAWNHAQTTTELRISPEKIYVKFKSKLGTKVQEMPINQLEEMHFSSDINTLQVHTRDIQSFGNDSCIMLRSDYTIIKIGHGLSKTELRWIASLIENAITL